MMGFIDNIVNRLRQIANPRSVIGTLAVFIAAVVLIQTVGFRPEVESMADGLALPEIQFAYTPGQVETVLDALGPDGRNLYIRALLVDYVFVLTFVAGLGVPLAYLLPKVKDNTWVVRMAAAPVIAGLCDYIENTVLLYSIYTFPDMPTTALWIASVATSLKLVLLFLSLALLGISGLLVLGRRLLR